MIPNAQSVETDRDTRLKTEHAHDFKADGLILFGLGLLASAIDRLWLMLDHSVPAWDQGDHLTRSLEYWRMLQHPEWFSGDWWQQLWQLSPSYRAPWVYLVTVPWLNGFGRGQDQATLVNVSFTALLLVALYLLGKALFNRQVGLWAAGLSLLAPALAYQRTDYLLDYGLAAMVTWTFASLTLWWQTPHQWQRWGWGLSWGLGLGLTFLTKPTAVIFLLVPLLYLLISLLWSKKLSSRQRALWLFQFVLVLGLAVGVAFPWFRTNWLTILTSSLSANAVGAREGDPGGNTLAGWLLYGKLLPEMVSWPIFYLSAGGLLLAIGKWIAGKPWGDASALNRRFRNSDSACSEMLFRLPTWYWLGSFCVAAYALCSLASNKDTRFILPYLPIVILLLAYCLLLLPGCWGRRLRWGGVGLAVCMLLFNLFPLPGLAHLPGQHRINLGKPWPHPQVISEIVQQAPYLRSTVGLNVANPEVNAFTFNFYGALQDFQVYAREPSWSVDETISNSRSWDWYLTKAKKPVQQMDGQNLLQDAIDRNPNLTILKTWTLPDQSQLRLHHSRKPAVVVQPVSDSLAQVRLQEVTLPSQSKPGQPVPINYRFVGPWKQLQQGMVVLTWQRRSSNDSPVPAGTVTTWFHDHGIGLGNLDAGAAPIASEAGFQVTEHLAMLPPANLASGTYDLTGLYLNRQTGQTIPLPMPLVSLVLSTDAPATPGPELDLITQLRQLIPAVQKGQLAPIFKTVARLNLYDPIQDYLGQAEQAARFRLSRSGVLASSTDVDQLYTLALVDILRQRTEPALETLSQILRLEPKQFYVWTYLAVVHLYNWQPKQAELALDQVARLQPQMPELKPLQGLSALLQLNLPRAWVLLSPLLRS